jgi:hypothetical protein
MPFDPRSQMRLDMPVLESQGRALGRVAAMHHDALTGRLIGLTVRHGFRGRNHTRVQTADMARVSQGVIVLVYDKMAFSGLPRCDAPARS